MPLISSTSPGKQKTPSGRGRRAGGASGRAQPAVRRSQVVWGALLASMTVVGGGLFALDRSPARSTDGLSLPPLLATVGPDTAEAIFTTRVPLDSARWQSIVIHDSGETVGTPTSLDAQARAMNLRGLGYHFVVGNGGGMDDGELHIASRWLRQLPGAHAAGKDADWFNRHSIGICLIGDGNRQRPSAAQMRRLVQVIEALRAEFKIPADRVYLHRDIATTPSPGRRFPESTFRQQLAADL